MHLQDEKILNSGENFSNLLTSWPNLDRQGVGGADKEDAPVGQQADGKSTKDRRQFSTGIANYILQLAEETNVLDPTTIRDYKLLEPYHHHEITAELLREIKSSDLKTFLLGDDHNVIHVDSQIEACERVRSYLNKPIKVAIEITPPEQLEFIRDYLKHVNRTKNQDISVEIREGQQAYRNKLLKNHCEKLGLLLLERGFEVVPLDTREVLKNAKQTSNRITFDDDSEIFATPCMRTQRVMRLYAEGVLRNRQWISTIKEERPDVIIGGSAHIGLVQLALGEVVQEVQYFPSDEENRVFHEKSLILSAWIQLKKL